jgi:hypothetical protein
MAGSVHVLSADDGALLCTIRPHTKYVVAAAWAAAAAGGHRSGGSSSSSSSAEASTGSELIATASYDGTVCLLKLVVGGGEGAQRDQAGQPLLSLEVLQQVQKRIGGGRAWWR